MKRGIIYLLLVIVILIALYVHNKKQNINQAVVLIESYHQNHLYKQGNGFVYKVDDYTYILTNYHVISDSDYLTVHINGKNVQAHILNYDEYEDIAIIIIDKKYGNNKLEISSGFDIKNSDKIIILTANGYKNGIVSNSVKPIKFNFENHNKMLDLIEINAQIEKGNSGSPILDTQNKVVGIITMVSEDKKNAYAIPINNFVNKIEAIEQGKFYRINLGIKATNNTQGTKGVLLEDVYIGGIASAVGLNIGDVIVRINNQDIEDISDFRYYLYKINKYELFQIGYYRNGTYNTTIVLAK